MHTTRTPNPFTRIAATVAFVFVALAMFTGIAAADTPAPFPEFQVDLPNLDPPPLPTPVVITDFELIPLRPTAEVEVDCESGTVDISVGNNSLNHWFIEISADGEVIGGGPIAPNHAMFEQIELAENDAVDVIVSILTVDTLIDETFTMDCLVPLPDYDIIADCDTGQAWARLINHGDDVALLGVQYPDVMHMEIEVEPHDSEDWLLAVSPGETVEFDIVSSNVSLGSEILDFTCEDPQQIDPVDQPVESETDDANQSIDEEQEIEAPVENATHGGAGAGPAADDESTTNAGSGGGNDGTSADDAETTGDDELAADQVLAVSDDGSSLGLVAALVLSGFGLVLLFGAAVAVGRGRNRV